MRRSEGSFTLISARSVAVICRTSEGRDRRASPNSSTVISLASKALIRTQARRVCVFSRLCSIRVCLYFLVHLWSGQYTVTVSSAGKASYLRGTTGTNRIAATDQWERAAIDDPQPLIFKMRRKRQKLRQR